MTLFEWISQVFGILGLIATIVGYNQQKKIWVLIASIIACTMYTLQYAFLAAWPAMAICIIAIVRSIVYYQYERKEKSKSVFVLILFLIIGTITSVLTYQDLFSLVPLFSTLAFTWALWQSDLRKYRVIAFIEPAMFMFYDFHVGAYAGMVATLVEFIGALVAMIRIDLFGKRE